MPTYKIINKAVQSDCIEMIKNIPLDGSHEVVIRPYKSSRSLDQNAAMWPLLEDLSGQVNWYGNKLTKEEWKDVLTAGLKKQKVVPGIDGGFVVVGSSTSKMDKKTFSELIELILNFGAQKNVKFSAKQVA